MHKAIGEGHERLRWFWFFAHCRTSITGAIAPVKNGVDFIKAACRDDGISGISSSRNPLVLPILPEISFRLGIPMKGRPTPDSLERLRQILARALANPAVTLTLDDEPQPALLDLRLAAAEKAMSLHTFEAGQRWSKLSPWETDQDDDAVLRRAALINGPGDSILVASFEVSFATGSDQIGDVGCFTRSNREVGRNPFSSRPEAMSAF